MTTILLFHFPPHVGCTAIRLTLEEREVEYKTRIINTLTNQNFKPEYLEFNEQMDVPTLIHESKVITNTSYILRYLDKNFEALLDSEDEEFEDEDENDAVCCSSV